MRRGIKPTLICGGEGLHSITKTPPLRGLAASTKKKRRRRGRQSRGQRLAARNRKRNEQVSPFQLLNGLTTLPQRQPCICLSAVKLFNPQSVTQRETAFTAIHGHKGPRSGLR